MVVAAFFSFRLAESFLQLFCFVANLEVCHLCENVAASTGPTGVLHVSLLVEGTARHA